MARCKNVGGGPGDEDLRPPPRLTTQEKGKAKKTITKKKRKFADVETERAAAVAAAVERAERGGAGSGVRIGDQLSPAQRVAVERMEANLSSPPGTIMLGGRRVSLEESQPQGETEQQTQPIDQT